MEKNGKIQLSKKEFNDIQRGVLPERIAIEWNLTLEEVEAMVNQGCYQLLPD
jgi:hypothetical protein